jgi:hypothetical protein
MVARPEQEIHRAVVTHLKIRGARGLVFWHTPSGGFRRKAEAGIFKAMGARSGVSDLILVHCSKIFCLELKAPGGRVSEPQLAFIGEMEAAGAFCCVADGLDRAIAVLEAWGLLLGKVA